MSHSQQQGVPPVCIEPHTIVLATLAGNEYHMPANLAHYEDLSQLEDDIVSFLPTVSDIEVFGCEIDLIEPDTQLPLRDPFHSTTAAKQIRWTFGGSQMSTRATQYAKVELQMAVMSVHIRSTSTSRLQFSHAFGPMK